MRRKRIPVKTVLSITHNTLDYKDKTEPRREVLEKVADYLWQSADEFGLQLCPITLERLHRIVDGEVYEDKAGDPRDQ